MPTGYSSCPRKSGSNELWVCREQRVRRAEGGRKAQEFLHFGKLALKVYFAAAPIPAVPAANSLTVPRSPIFQTPVLQHRLTAGSASAPPLHSFSQDILHEWDAARESRKMKCGAGQKWRLGPW